MSTGDLETLLFISYRIIIPICICTGLVINIFAIYLLAHEKRINIRLMMLLMCDNILLFLGIFPAITLNGCEMKSPTELILLANIPYTFFYIFQSCSIFIIMMISLSRFLAVHKPFMGKIENKHYDLVMIFILSIILHVSDSFEYDIVCDNHLYINNTCTHYYIDYNAFRNTYYGTIWWYIRFFLGMGIPFLLILLFNSGLIVSIIYRKVTNSRYKTTVYTSVYISTTFIICFLPLTIHAHFFSKNIYFCHGPFKEEIFRSIGNILLMLNSISHGIIVILQNKILKN